MAKRLFLLTSGWGKQDWTWGPFTSLCKEQGYDALLLSYPNQGFSAIQDSAKAVTDLVEAVRGEYEHITFVGHSMGGLIGRYLIQRTDVGRSFDAYVSIGTPHHGTYLAFLSPWSKSARQMTPGSPFLRRLNESEWPEDIPALCVRGGFEEIVLPRSNGCFDRAEEVIIPSTSHLGLLFNPQTFWEIWAWLTEAFFPDDLTIPKDTRAMASTVRIPDAQRTTSLGHRQ